MTDAALEPRIEHWESLGDDLGIDLFIARDDLLPFPLAGNKVRKLMAELARCTPGTAVITNGAVDSNHCRTLAWLAAQRGLVAYCVLHDEKSQGPGAPGLVVLDALGARYSVVQPDRIALEITRAKTELSGAGIRSVRVVPGGCHSELGAMSYRDAARIALNQVSPDAIYVASGTGATQGGIAAAAKLAGGRADVIGVSVARAAERGTRAVQEAARWAGAPDAEIRFHDNFTAGGYAKSTPALRDVVAWGWKHGLPLDETYTGKAMWALRTHIDEGRLAGKRVLFWHTGGLWNHLSARVMR